MIRLLQIISRSLSDETQSVADQLFAAASPDTSTRRMIVADSVSAKLRLVARLRAARSQVDVVHVFGFSLLGSVALAGPGRIVFSPERAPESSESDWLRAIMGTRDVRVVCPTDTIRRMLVERGVPIEQTTLIRPGVDFSSVKPRRDQTLRERLGLRSDSVALLAVGESTRAADHELLCRAASILNVLDQRFEIIFAGRGAHAENVRRFSRKIGLQRYSIWADEILGRGIRQIDLLPAADVLLVGARGPVDTLPIQIGMASGLPIVSTVSSTVAELLQDRHNALLVARGEPRLFAQRVLDLQGDSQLQWNICDQARAEAYQFFPLSKMIGEFDALYRAYAADRPTLITAPTTD